MTQYFMFFRPKDFVYFGHMIAYCDIQLTYFEGIRALPSIVQFNLANPNRGVRLVNLLGLVK